MNCERRHITICCLHLKGPVDSRFERFAVVGEDNRLTFDCFLDELKSQRSFHFRYATIILQQSNIALFWFEQGDHWEKVAQCQ